MIWKKFMMKLLRVLEYAVNAIGMNLEKINKIFLKSGEKKCEIHNNIKTYFRR